MADHPPVVTAPTRSTSLAPAPGVTPAPEGASQHRFLSDELIARDLVQPEAMRVALQASLTGRSLTELLVGNGDLSEQDLARTLAAHHRLDHVDLEQFPVDCDAAALIRPDVARRLGAVPIAYLPSDTVVVALYELNGSTAVLELARLTERTIQPAVASRTQIEALIESLRHRDPAVRAAAVAPAQAEPMLRSLSSASIVVSTDGQSDDPRRASASTFTGAVRQALGEPEIALQFEGHLGPARERAELAERRRFEAEERARAAQEQARDAEARARVADERAQAAEQLVDAAQARAEDATVAIEAANHALARLLGACEVLERHSHNGGPDMEAGREQLDAGRDRRAPLQEQPPAAQHSSLVRGLRTRIAELEHQLAQRPLPQPITHASSRPRTELAGEEPDGPGAAAEGPDEDCADVMAQGPDGSGASVAAEGSDGSGPSVVAAEVHGASEGALVADGSPEYPGGRRRIFGNARRGG